jgi:circadian clock protein KaiB
VKKKKSKTSRPPSVVPRRAGRRVDATRAFEKALATQPRRRKHVLRLYVAGATDRSREALLRVRQLCETELNGQYDLQVIDIYQQPILARDGQILATPTLVREFPRPVRRLIGNLSNATGLFVGLNLNTKGKTAL